MSTRNRRPAVVLVMLAVGLVAFAGPAAAAPGQNTATGILAAGTIDAGPIGQSNFPDGAASPAGDTDTVLSAEVAPLLTSGTINTFAGPSSATASVADVALSFGGNLFSEANAVSSSCSSVNGAVTGETTIVGGSVTAGPFVTPDGVTSGTEALDPAPAPNTEVFFLTGAAIPQFLLNRQTMNADGSLTVDAIFIELADGQTITIASVTCQPEILAIPVIAPQIAAGAVVVGLLVVGSVLCRRRESASPSA